MGGTTITAAATASATAAATKRIRTLSISRGDESPFGDAYEATNRYTRDAA